jgi:hypothetical protein
MSALVSAVAMEPSIVDIHLFVDEADEAETSADAKTRLARLGQIPF